MKNTFKLMLLSAVIFATACKKTDSIDSANDGFKTYTIQQGNNYSDDNGFATVTNKSSIEFDVIFDNTAKYATTIATNQYDINKLYGFSDCGTTHQTNSARFGWNWVDNQLQLHAYCYVDGVRINKLIGTVPLNETQHCKITVSGNSYIFQLNSTSVTMERHCSGSLIDGYKLYPYFGGDETAPHAVTIKIKEY